MNSRKKSERERQEEDLRGKKKNDLLFVIIDKMKTKVEKKERDKQSSVKQTNKQNTIRRTEESREIPWESKNEKG